MTSRIFVFFAAVAALLGLTGCDQQPVTMVALPADVAAVTTPFLAAVRRGDKAAAEKFVTDGFADDSRGQFDKMSALLKKSPVLVPAIYHPRPGAFGPNNNEVKLIFAAKEGDRWITSQIRMKRRENDKFKIQYWDVNSDTKPPELLKHANQMKQYTTWFTGGLALMALLGVALLIWVVKQRTHIISPDPVIETRRVASTVRDGDE